MMSLTASIRKLFISACLLQLCGAMRGSLSSSSSAKVVTPATFQCGKGNGPCGSAIPAGVTCAKGPGWCEPGYYCGSLKNQGEPSKCLAVRKDCGTVGKDCCSSNTVTPHTNLEEKLTRAPFCKDGSYCFYFKLERGGFNGDIYAGNPGVGPCTAVPAGCGTGPGSPCCPTVRRPADASQPEPVSQPPLQHIHTSCAGETEFCDFDHTPVVCELNDPDCGQLGKPCCILNQDKWRRMSTGGVISTTKCGGAVGEPGFGKPSCKFGDYA